MDWNAIFSEIILTIIGIILTAIGGFVAVQIDKYVKNEQLKTTIASFHDLVRDSVLETYQVYVQELKDNNIFTEKAQNTALSACLEQIKANMPQRVETWLKSNVKGVDGYIISQIEATIADLKNSGK